MRCLTLHYNCGFIFLPIFASFILKLLLGICTFVIFVTLTLTFCIVFKCCSSLVMLLVLESVLSQVYIIALTLLFSSCIFFRPFPLKTFGIIFKVTVQTAYTWTCFFIHCNSAFSLDWTFCCCLFL